MHTIGLLVGSGDSCSPRASRMKAHSTAEIDAGASIGEGTMIWHWSHVCAGAKIGTRCSIGQNAYIGNEAIIGNGVKIQNNVSIYDKVIIEDNVFCGPSAVFTNVKNPRSEISRKSEYLTTLIKTGATLGANCTVVCGITIGKYAFVAAGSVVTKDIKDYALVMGIPAVQVGWMSRHGERIPLPTTGSGTWLCPNNGEIYRLNNGTLEINRPYKSDE